MATARQILPPKRPTHPHGMAYRLVSASKTAFAVFAIVAITSAPAQPQKESEPEERKIRLLSTLLNNELPFTNPESALQLGYSAKFSDVIKEPYIRLPLELRYGVSEYTEAYLAYQPYVNNPFDSHAVSSSGITGIGFKRRIPNFLNEQWDFAYGLRTFLPLSEIPSFDPRNQFARYEPYLVTTYQLPSDERYRWTLHARYDWVKGEPFFENNIEPRPSSTLYLRPGIIFTPPGEWRYTLEFEYQTERLSGAENDGALLAASVGWFPEGETWLSRLPGEFDFTLRIGYALKQLPIDRIGSPEEVDLRIRWSKRKQR